MASHLLNRNSTKLITNPPIVHHNSLEQFAMADTAFRKIDIDAYDEDTLLESELYEPDPRDPGMVLNDAKQKQTAVRSSLSR